MGCDVWGSRQKVQLRSKARHREGSVGNREAGGRAGARPTGVRSGERGPWNAGGTSQQSRENSPEPKLCVSRSEALPPAASRRLPARGPREGPTEARGSGNGSRVPGSAGSQRAVPGSRSPSPQAHEQGRAVGRATSPSLTTASRGWRPHLASEETASAARVGHGEPQRAGPRPREDQRGQRLQTHAPREQTRGVGPQSGTVPWAHLRGTGSPPDMNAGHPYYRCCDGTNVFIIHSPALSRVSRMRPRWMCKSVSQLQGSSAPRSWLRHGTWIPQPSGAPGSVEACGAIQGHCVAYTESQCHPDPGRGSVGRAPHPAGAAHGRSRDSPRPRASVSHVCVRANA